MSSELVQIESDMKELVETYLENRKKEVVHLRDLVSQKKWDEIQVIGHKLAGNGGSYGFPVLGNIGKNIEDEAKLASDDFSKVNQLIDQVDQYLAVVQVEYVD